MPFTGPEKDFSNLWGAMFSSNGVIGNPPGKINFGKKSNQKRNPRDPT